VGMTTLVWVSVTAALAVVYIAKGRARGSDTVVLRLRRLQGEGHEPGTRESRRARSLSLRRITELPAKLIPAAMRTMLARDLARVSALSGMTLEQLIGLRVWSAAALPLAVLAVFRFSAAALLLLAPAVAAGAMFPNLLAARNRSRYLDDIRRALPHTADMLYAFVLGGKNLDQAFRSTAGMSPEPLRPLLLQAVREMELGSSREESFNHLRERCPLPELSTLLRSLLEGERRGHPLSGTLEVFSREIRVRHRDQVRATVAKTPLKILAPLVFLILPASIILTVGPTFLVALKRTL